MTRVVQWIMVIGAALAEATVALRVSGQQAPAARWELATSPVLELGGDGADGVALERVLAATRTRTGYAIADATRPAVLLFDARGAFVRQIGRRGRGPGEFTSTTWVGQCGSDSLVVWDAQESRVSVFAPTGDFVRQFQAPLTSARTACIREGVLAFLGFPPNGPPDPSGTAPPDSVALIFTNLAGRTLPERLRVPVGDGRLFSPVTTVAAAGSHFYVATGQSAFIDVYDGRVQRVSRIGVPGSRRRTTRAAHERGVDALLDGMRAKGPRRDAQREMLLRMSIPEWYPPYRDVVATPEGTVWVTTTSAIDGDTVTRIQAVNPRGAMVGEGRWTYPARLLEVGPDYLLATYENASGVPVVGVFRIRPVR